jgi:hypothetical protein
VKRASVLLVCVAAFWAVACSNSGGTSTTPPPPTGPFSNSSLNGQYAFIMTGSEARSTGNVEPYARIGSFTALGNGTISTGVEDVSLATGINYFGFTGGSYDISGDGTGSLTLTDSSGTLTFAITLASSSTGYLIEVPTDLESTASGSFMKQDAAQFGLTGISNNYAFDFSGMDSTGLPRSVVGQFFSNGGGSFSTGVDDDNDGAVITNGGNQQINGSYAADGLNPTDLVNFGRGDFSLGGITGVFYIVGSNEVLFLETTSGGLLTGTALLQTGIPTTTAGISGGFVYVMGGSGAGGPLARGGKFSTSGGSLSKIIVDNNNAGILLSLNTSTGTYTIDSSGDGRGTVAYNVSGQKNTFQYVFYLVSPNQAFIQDQSIGIVADGSMMGQGTSNITNASLAGTYALNWSGVTSASGSSGEEDLVGQTTLSSSDALTGTANLNEFSTDKQYLGTTLTGQLTLASDPTSHNTLTINLETNPANDGISFFAYVANNNNVLLMSTQTVRIAAGVLAPQTQ